MPSFDIVSEVDMHELNNSVDQANREISNRYDFKGVEASIQQNESVLVLEAPSDFQIEQMLEILIQKMAKRGIDVACLDKGKTEESLNKARKNVTVRQGIEKDLAKKIVKLVKDTKIKVQTAIQGEKLRVTGKKRDDLQQVISALREADLDMPLQFENFRD